MLLIPSNFLAQDKYKLLQSAKKLVFTFFDSPLNRNEVNFILRVVKLIQTKNAFFLISSKQLINLLNSVLACKSFLSISELKKGVVVASKNHIEFEEVKQLDFTAVLQILKNEEEADEVSISLMLALKLNIPFAFFIFKLKNREFVKKILDISTEINEPPLVFCPDPFNSEYSANVFALKEGGVLVFDEEDMTAFLNLK